METKKFIIKSSGYSQEDAITFGLANFISNTKKVNNKDIDFKYTLLHSVDHQTFNNKNNEIILGINFETVV